MFNYDDLNISGEQVTNNNNNNNINNNVKKTTVYTIVNGEMP